MKVIASVEIGNGTFEKWKKFFDSYASERAKYTSNESIEKITDQSAQVTFEIIDFDGLTSLSSRPDILETEALLQVKTTIIS